MLKKSLSILTVALASGIILSGCNKGPTYTIKEEDYLVLRSKLTSPRVFLDANFTISGDAQVKIETGKVDLNIEGDRYIFVLKKDTYNPSTTIIDADSYYYDIDDRTWYHTYGEDELNNLLLYSGLYFLSVLPSSYDALSYNENKHEYTAIGKADNEAISITFSFLDGNLVYYAATSSEGGHVILNFSDYGSTKVVIPSVYEELDD